MVGQSCLAQGGQSQFRVKHQRGRGRSLDPDSGSPLHHCLATPKSILHQSLQWIPMAIRLTLHPNPTVSLCIHFITFWGCKGVASSSTHPAHRKEIIISLSLVHLPGQSTSAHHSRQEIITFTPLCAYPTMLPTFFTMILKLSTYFL